MTKRPPEQLERNKRAKNCVYWRQNYGIHVNPDDLENYCWFKQNRTLCLRLMPLMDKLQFLQRPIEYNDLIKTREIVQQQQQMIREFKLELQEKDRIIINLNRDINRLQKPTEVIVGNLLDL